MQVYREASRIGEGGGWKVRVLGEEHRKTKAEAGAKPNKSWGKGKAKAESAEGVVASVVPEVPLEGPTGELG